MYESAADMMEQNSGKKRENGRKSGNVNDWLSIGNPPFATLAQEEMSRVRRFQSLARDGCCRS